jgi:hypothetical protein
MRLLHHELLFLEVPAQASRLCRLRNQGKVYVNMSIPAPAATRHSFQFWQSMSHSLYFSNSPIAQAFHFSAVIPPV